MKTLPLITSLLAIATVLPAQTQTLRGGVEDVQGTVNQFFLDCTNIPVVSNAVNLNLWTNTETIMQVVNIGSAQSPILRVDSIAPTAKTFDMGNLRFGQSNSWEVNAPAGSFAMVFVDFTWNTGFTPFGLESYLLGPNAFSLAAGVTNAQNQFQFQYMIPNMPQHTGISVTGQALIGAGGGLLVPLQQCRLQGNRQLTRAPGAY